MKKLILVIVAGLMAFNANAQFFAGMSFDVNYTNSGTKTAVAKVIDEEKYGVCLQPQVGWFLSEKLAVGTRLSFNMNRGKTYDSIYDEITDATSTSTTIRTSIGWDIAPFVRYNLFKFGGEKKRWGVWAEAHAYFGMNYPAKGIFNDFLRDYTYGIQAMPVLSFDLTPKNTIMLHVAILSLGYAGQTTVYDDHKEFKNSALLFTGKLSGLVRSAFTDGLYGLKIGMYKKF